MIRRPPRSTLSLHDALPIYAAARAASERRPCRPRRRIPSRSPSHARSEEHTSELQSLRHLVCRLLLEKKKKKTSYNTDQHNIHQHNENTQNTYRITHETDIQ